MQTFLPYPDFDASARVLDRQRLGKQRVECWQILRALDRGGGWVRHPAVRMWAGYEDALRANGRAVCREWRLRGYRDTMLDRFQGPEIYRAPPWLGVEEFHASHRSNLLRKNCNHYGALGWGEGPGLAYVWPGE